MLQNQRFRYYEALLTYTCYVVTIKTHFTWTQEIAKKHFKFENLDINKPIFHMLYDSSEKDTISAPKVQKKNILKGKKQIFTTTISIRMLYDTQENIFYVD